MHRVRVCSFEPVEVAMRTRMPFKYGIATLTDLPHLIVRFTVDVDGQIAHGWAGDGLPPKWFTKDPQRDPRDEIDELRRAIHNACERAISIGPCESAFDLWKSLCDEQTRDGRVGEPAALLTNFGTSFVERGVIDAICRCTSSTFADAVRGDALGIRLGAVHSELAGQSPRELLPRNPSESVIVRHTVGLADPLRDAEIAPNKRLEDGLPQSLEAAMAAYGLTHFKIKIGGDVERDLSRLIDLAKLLDRDGFAFTLDGNESYRAIEPFRELWDRATRDPSLRGFLKRLIFVEQPLHRDVALSDDARRAFAGWQNRPRMIIDESDATTASLPRALEVGYVGTSHKNCKGIFKGIANAWLVAHRNRTRGAQLVLSGEDLSNVGPVALLQDLAVLATLGVTHAERNGHHYFRGLSAFDPRIQQQLLDHHPDLYRRHESGFATVRIEEGRISTRSVALAPFGCAFETHASAARPSETI